MTRQRYEAVRPRPHPIGKVVHAAANGGGVVGALVLAALAVTDIANVLPIPTWVYGTATLVSYYGGAWLQGRTAQTKVEQQVTPLSDPMDADGRPLVAKPPKDPPAFEQRPYR